jgi:hypothetical protein
MFLKIKNRSVKGYCDDYSYSAHDDKDSILIMNETQ